MWRFVTLGARGIGDKWLHRRGHKMFYSKQSIADVYYSIEKGFYAVIICIFGDSSASETQG